MKPEPLETMGCREGGPAGGPSERAAAVLCRRTALAGSLVAVGVSGVALLGRITGHVVELPGQLWPSRALTWGASFMLMLLGLALFCRLRFSAHPLGRALVRAAAVLAVAWAVVDVFALGFDWPALLTWLLGLPGAMSSFTLSCCIMTGIALYLQATPSGHKNRSLVSGLLALTVLLANLWMLLRFFHGRPSSDPLDIRGIVITPATGPAALSWIAVATALIAAGGPRHFLVRPFVGTSTQALLLRSFLPVTVAAVFITGVLYGAPLRDFIADFALLSTVWTFLSALLFAVVIVRMSHGIAAQIDRAEKEKKQAVDEMDQLRASRDAAESASLAKIQFLANMSHELRTPLTAIMGYVELLQEEAQQQELATIIPDLNQVHEQSVHLQSLINDLFDMSRIDSGKMNIFPETFDVGTMLRDVAGTVGKLVVKNSNAFEPHFGDRLGSMHADVIRLRQCLFNLLSNAGKFTENGVVRLSATCLTRAGQEWLAFEVKDTGIGMSPEQIRTVIEPFAQVDRTTTRKHGGTGLGLAITNRLCRMMGGELTVTSALGQGSAFTILLPRSVSGQPAEVVPPPREEPPTPQTGTNDTILVIDDEKTVRDVLERVLRKEGYRVVTCGSGPEGLRLARQIRPQAITLDVMMPNMDGWSVLSALKADPDVHDIPVIMLTVVEDRNLGLALGAADYLTKPLDRSRLLDVLHRRLGPGGGKLALIVDDEPALRQMLHLSLEKSGWEVIEAADGREALELLGKRQPTLLLLDLLMPEMDGFELLSEIRQHPEWHNIPVIVLTAKELTAEEREFLSGSIVSCVRRVLQKGNFSREQLLREVSEVTAG